MDVIRPTNLYTNILCNINQKEEKPSVSTRFILITFTLFIAYYALTYFISRFTLDIKMNRHLVAAVSVGRDAKISPAVLATGADETENTDCTVGSIILFQSVTVVGKLGI